MTNLILFIQNCEQICATGNANAIEATMCGCGNGSDPEPPSNIDFLSDYIFILIVVVAFVYLMARSVYLTHKKQIK